MIRDVYVLHYEVWWKVPVKDWIELAEKQSTAEGEAGFNLSEIGKELASKPSYISKDGWSSKAHIHVAIKPNDWDADDWKYELEELKGEAPLSSND